LLAVLALIFAVWWIIKHGAKRAGGLRNQLGVGGRAPSGVVAVLGRYPIARNHSLVLMKVDRRVLVLDQSASGFRTLSELTDPEEVASVLIKTRDEEGESMSKRFESMLRDLERDPDFAHGEGPRTVRHALEELEDRSSDPRKAAATAEFAKHAQRLRGGVIA